MKIKLDENLPVSASAVLQAAGNDVDTVIAEGLTGAPDPEVVAAATAADRILISLDRGLGDIRSYPPGSHSGIVVLRLTDQSPATVSRAIADLAGLTDAATWPEPSQSCNADYCASAIPDLSAIALVTPNHPPLPDDGASRHGPGADSRPGC